MVQGFWVEKDKQGVVANNSYNLGIVDAKP